jgi:hypothetical protein
LVALAVARMRALETFVWDMPTGILRDVWLSLSSLGERDDGQPCRLEKVWVRWHDNTSADGVNPVPPPPPPMNLNAIPPAPLQPTMSGGLLPQIHPAALDRVEHPSFSVLPQLTSLSVLDIDELAYLDEMAVLIAKSLDKLRELRVGLARHAMARDWVTVWEGDHLQQVDHDYPTAGSLTIGEKRLGGVLGTLTGFVCDMRRPKINLPDRTRRRSPKVPTPSASPDPIPATETETEPLPQQPRIEVPNLETVPLPSLQPERVSAEAGEALQPEVSWSPVATLSPDDALESDPLVALTRQASPEPASVRPVDLPESSVAPTDSLSGTPVRNGYSPRGDEDTYETFEPEQQYLDNVLQLESLELERVPLSVPVLQRALDWTRLTSLTLLHCQNHEQLWKTLRKSFAPTPKSPTYPTPRRTSGLTPRKGKSALPAHGVDWEYSLKLKKVHTNTVSPALISFLKETLAPNSLEVLFLQETRTYSSPVAIDPIFRGPIRRHRNSLKKVLIDSSEKGPEGLPTSSSRWRRWMLSRENLDFLCSGKMPALKELGMAIDYRDWVSSTHSSPTIRLLYD